MKRKRVQAILLEDWDPNPTPSEEEGKGKNVLSIGFTAAVFLILTSLLLPSPAHAAIQWGLSVVEGYYLPRLDELNYVLKNERVELGPRNTEARPSSYPVIYQGLSPAMPEMEPKSPKTGLQIQADINPRYAVTFGGSMAVFESSKRDVRRFFVGFWIPANRETRFSLSLNQFWLGVKRYWTWKGKSPQPSPVKEESTPTPETSSGQAPSLPSQGGGGAIPSPHAGEGKGGGVRFYTEIGILAITKASLTTDVWLHVYAPDEGFDFYKVTETEARGNGYATYLGVGGEYYIKKWLSIGLDIDYTVGGIRNMKFARWKYPSGEIHGYFTVDPLEKDIIKPGDTVLYTDSIKGRIVPLFLELEGWDLKGQVRFYF